MSRALDHCDPLDPETVECPYALYARLREEAPVWPAPGRDFFLVTRYEDIVHVLRTPAIFSADYRSLINQRPEVAAILAEGEPIAAGGGEHDLATTDPPDHRRYRTLVNKAFTPARVDGLRPEIEELANTLIDAFADDGELEIVQQFAFPLTMVITAKQLGLPESDLPKFREWSEARISQFSLLLSPEEECEAARKRIEFQSYFRDLLEEKRRAPTDDMISVLALARLDGADRGLTVGEFLGIAEQIMTAGNHTTTQAFASGALMLATQPGLLERVLAGRSGLAAFIEEVLRLEPPAAGVWRVTTTDTELGGVRIPAGSAVHVRLASGNRDEARFARADELDLERSDKEIRAHLAFGYGAHACIGMLLARRELEIGFSALLSRLHNLRLAPGEHDLRHVPSFMIRGLRELRLAFDRER